MIRKVGQLALDSQTNKTWVCVGGSETDGWMWVHANASGNACVSLEFNGTQSSMDPSLFQALKELDAPLGQKPSPVAGKEFQPVHHIHGWRAGDAASHIDVTYFPHRDDKYTATLCGNSVTYTAFGSGSDPDTAVQRCLEQMRKKANIEYAAYRCSVNAFGRFIGDEIK